MAARKGWAGSPASQARAQRQAAVSALERSAQAGLRGPRRDFLAGLLRADRRIGSAYRRLTREIRKVLPNGPRMMTRAEERALVDAIERVMRGSLTSRVNVIGGAVTSAGRHGSRAGAGSLQAQGITPPGPVPFPEQRNLGGLLAQVDRQTARRMAQHLSTVYQSGFDARTVGTELARISGGALQEQAPRYVERIASAVRASPSNSETRRILQSFQRQVRPSLNTGNAFGIRSAQRRLMRRLRTAVGADVDQAVASFVEDKALYRARVIARTESSRAFREMYVRRTQESDAVVGYRWNLSGAHPIPDICDVLAGQDLDGLGRGGYGKSGLPDGGPPAHPNCLCFVTTIRDPDYFERDQLGPFQPGPENAVPSHRWLQSQPRAIQRQLLGPTRYKLFRRNPASVFDGRGRIRTVGELRRSR